MTPHAGEKRVPSYPEIELSGTQRKR